jgi:hypothetical protein
MWALDIDGRPSQLLGTASRAFGVLAPGARTKKLSLQTLSTPGAYRLDVTFEDRQRRQLGAYSEYLLVRDPVLDLRLSGGRRTFHPGDVVITREENYGNEVAVSSYSYEVQRLTTGGWVFVGPRRLSVPLVLKPLWPGRAACIGFGVPPNASPGHYRLVREYKGSDPVTGESLPFTLTREFNVVP